MHYRIKCRKLTRKERKLLQAVEADNIDEMIKLLRKGVDFNLLGYLAEETPLIMSVRNQNVRAMTLLLGYGAAVDLGDRSGYTPLMYAFINNFRLGVELLLAFSADINSQNRLGDTALHIAVATQNVNVVKLLLECGAKLDIKNWLDLTPYKIAVIRGYDNIVEMFEKYRYDKIVFNT